MEKRFMITSINLTKNYVTLSPVIKCKSKKTGDEIEFTVSEKDKLEFREIESGDVLGRICVLTKTFK